jgi:hypothetical protein
MVERYKVGNNEDRYSKIVIGPADFTIKSKSKWEKREEEEEGINTMRLNNVVKGWSARPSDPSRLHRGNCSISENDRSPRAKQSTIAYNETMPVVDMPS